MAIASSLRRGQHLPATGWIHAIDVGPEQREPRRIDTGHGLGLVAVGHGAIWVANGWSRTLGRLDLETLELDALMKLGKVPAALTVGRDSVWVLGTNGWLWRVSPAEPRADAVARLGRRARGLAAHGPWVWALRESGELVRFDPVAGEEDLEIEIGRRARNLIATEENLWATSDAGRRLSRIDPFTGTIEEVKRFRGRIVCLAAGQATVWCGCTYRSSGRKGTLCRVNATASESGPVLNLTAQPRAIACGADAVWIACGRRRRKSGTTQRLDPVKGSLLTIDETKWPIYRLAVAGDWLLATMSLNVTHSADGGSGVIYDFGAMGGGDGGGGGGGGGHH